MKKVCIIIILFMISDTIVSAQQTSDPDSLMYKKITIAFNNAIDSIYQAGKELDLAERNLMSIKPQTDSADRYMKHILDDIEIDLGTYDTAKLDADSILMKKVITDFSKSELGKKIFKLIEADTRSFLKVKEIEKTADMLLRKKENLEKKLKNKKPT